jgi:hypothetical protein
MTPTKFFVVAAVGLSATACSYSNTTTAAAPVPVAYRSGAEQACLDYGFNPGTDPYNRCVVREAQSRAAGRMPPDYAMARINGDARDACYSYGLTIGGAPYDRCVGREIEARRYRDQAVVTTVPAYPATTVYTPAPGTTVYTPSPYAPAPVATVYTQGPVTYAPAAPTPPAGVQAFRDEFGFRYDGQGNRIDAQGNIISPQSTRP